MKKIARIAGITLGSLIILILAAALLIPVFFKDKIKNKVETEINAMLNANVKFSDYNLSLFKAFPKAAFSISDVSVTGKDKFEGDTLASIKSFDLVFNLASIFSDSGYEIKSLVIDKPYINALVLKDGSANWDIMAEDTTTVTETETESASSFKLQMKEFRINDARIRYSDKQADMAAFLDDLDFLLKGNMSAIRTDLDMLLNVGALTFGMEKINYLSAAKIELKATVDALLDSMNFTLKDNYLKINDIKLAFSGNVAMPGDDITTDLKFSTSDNSFKSLLSLIPAVYMEGFEDLRASGTFSLDGNVTGVYSSADSTMPNAKLNLLVDNGVISYPDLPEKISAIALKTAVDFNGTNMDLTTVDVSKFHMELAGNPFDFAFHLATPMSDPSFALKAVGKIDLAKLQQAVPLDSISLNGIIDMAMTMSGRMSMVEKEQYDKFTAEGKLNIKSMVVDMTDMPLISISEASMILTPAYSELTKLNLKVGEKSDFSITGRLENYIPYIFSDGIIAGNLNLASSLIDANDIMKSMASDTTSVEDTTSLAVIVIPKNISFNFDASVKKLLYENLEATNFKGNIVVKDGIVTLNNTGMDALGGKILMNAVYDTRDSLKPMVKADLAMTTIGVKKAFDAFNSVKLLAPGANGLDGNVSVTLKYDGLLGSNMMPVISSINGAGTLKSDQLQIVQSDAFDKMKSVIKLSDKYTNIVKNINASFSIKDGRIYVKPFDVKLGNIKMNLGGDQGLDKKINYVVKTEIPRSDLGEAANSLVNSLASQAASYGLKFSPSDVIKINLNVGGTFSDPVIKPAFGESSSSTSMTGTATTAVKEQVTEKVTDVAKEQSDKLIKEAEEQAQKIRDEAASAAKTIREQADTQSAKLIKEAEAKGPLAVVAAKKIAEKTKTEAYKKATALETEANARADKLIEDAKAKSTELLNK